MFLFPGVPVKGPGLAKKRQGVMFVAFKRIQLLPPLYPGSSAPLAWPSASGRGNICFCYKFRG